jgi:hypothetical protein
MQTKLDAFTRGYLETLLWSSTDESTPSGGYPLDRNFSNEDFSKEALAQCVADCQEFQRVCEDYLTTAGDFHAGHDFWLTRNGHGAGFWDDGGKNYTRDEGDLLTMASKVFGEVNPYVSNDGTEVCL